MYKLEPHANGKVASETAAIYRELLTLRAEVKHLHDKLPAATRGSKIVRAAVVDGHMLIMQAFSGESTGCTAMGKLGMTKRRWAWAVAFLRYAGIVARQTKNWRAGLEFVITDLAECITLLERAGTELMDRPGGYKKLVALLRDV